MCARSLDRTRQIAAIYKETIKTYYMNAIFRQIRFSHTNDILFQMTNNFHIWFLCRAEMIRIGRRPLQLHNFHHKFSVAPLFSRRFRLDNKNCLIFCFIVLHFCAQNLWYNSIPANYKKKRVDKQTAIKKKIKKNSPTFWRSPISIIEIINFVAVEIWQTHLIFVQLSSMKLARYWHRVHIYCDIRKNRMNLIIVPCFAIQRAPITLQMKWKHGLNKVFIRILWPNVRHFKCNFVYSSNSFEHLPLLTDFWHYFGVFFFVPNCVRWFLAALFDSTNREKAIACEQMSEWTNAKDALNGFLACTRKKFYFYNDCDTFEKRNEQICVYLKKNVIQIRHL